MIIRELSTITHHLFFCNGDACTERGAFDSTKAIRNCIKACGLHDTVHTAVTRCNGRCHDGPVVISMPDCTYYQQIKPENATEFVERVLQQGEIWEEKVLYAWGEPAVRPTVTTSNQ
jgi:(2Fe-2S) ferredoxin